MPRKGCSARCSCASTLPWPAKNRLPCFVWPLCFYFSVNAIKNVWLSGHYNKSITLNSCAPLPFSIDVHLWILMRLFWWRCEGSGITLLIWWLRDWVFHLMFGARRSSVPCFWEKYLKSPELQFRSLERVAEERWGKWRGHVFVHVLNDLQRIMKRIGAALTHFWLLTHWLRKTKRSPAKREAP